MYIYTVQANICRCIHVHLFIYIYVCIYTYVCIYAYIYIYMCIERPSPNAADANPEHVTHPRPTPGDSGGPRNQQCNQSIVHAHSVRTLGVLDGVLEGSLGVPLGSPGAPRILNGVHGVSGRSLEGPGGVPGKSLGVSGGSLEDPQGVCGGF